MLQLCTVLANECWRDMPPRIVQSSVTIGGCFYAMDVATHSVKVGFPRTTQPVLDVYRIYGMSSTRLPLVCQRVPAHWGVILAWLVLCLGSLRTFSGHKDNHKKQEPRHEVAEAAGSDDAPSNV